MHYPLFFVFNKTTQTTKTTKQPRHKTKQYQQTTNTCSISGTLSEHRLSTLTVQPNSPLFVSRLGNLKTFVANE